jgi:hypothetical protein
VFQFILDLVSVPCLNTLLNLFYHGREQQNMETLHIPICSRAGDGAGEAVSILVAAPMSKSSSGTDPRCVEALRHSGGADASSGPDVLAAAGARGGPCSRQRGSRSSGRLDPTNSGGSST